MKISRGALLVFGVAWVVRSVTADTPFLVGKGRVFLQTSGAAPAMAPSGGAVFVAEAPGAGGPPLIPGASVTLPGGAAKALAYVADDDVFRWEAAVNTTVELAAAYPVGDYTVGMLGDVLGQLKVTIALPVDAFPAAVQVGNYAATQAVDPQNDFDLQLRLPAGVTADDRLSVDVRDGANRILNDWHGADEGRFTLASGSLEAGHAYDVRVRLTRLTVDETTFPVPAYEFFSETRFTLKTTGSGGGGGTTDLMPPTLADFAPTNGAVSVSPQSTVAFVFSESMDPAHMDIQWAGTVDPTKFSYSWLAENTVLSASYAGALPSGAQSWVLNPVAGAPDNFRDAAGNLLAAATYRGSFVVAGAGGGCASGDVSETAGFGILKLVNHRQVDSGAPANDPVEGAGIQAFSRLGDAPGRAAIEFPADPAPKPHQLKFFQSLGAGVEILNQHFDARADLDAAYPAGAYDFQLRDRQAPTTVIAHVVLNLVATGYPPAPRFSEFAAAQSIATNSDFTLRWDAFAGADPANDSLSLEITDAAGNTVLSLPDSCANKPLPVTATSAVLPRGLLLGGGSNYIAALTFMRLNDKDRAMPGTTGRGVAAVGRTTRMSLRSAGSASPPSAPVFRAVRLDGTGATLSVTLECTPGRILTLESATDVAGTYTTLLSTNPVASPLILPVANAGASRFFRARAD